VPASAAARMARARTRMTHLQSSTKSQQYTTIS
jgi:hypothetical protein